MPVTVVPARVPARLSQKMLLNRAGRLKQGAFEPVPQPATPPGRVACSWELFSDVDSPAGAGSPFEVTAVAVVRFFMIVLFTTRTLGASSRPIAPPSWVETL